MKRELNEAESRVNQLTISNRKGNAAMKTNKTNSNSNSNATKSTKSAKSAKSAKTAKSVKAAKVNKVRLTRATKTPEVKAVEVKAVEVKAVEVKSTKTAKSDRKEIVGLSPCSAFRAMGKSGFTGPEAVTIAKHFGVELHPGTISSHVSKGKTGNSDYGTIENLSKEQNAELKAIIAKAGATKNGKK